jgi:hypothetical protein
MATSSKPNILVIWDDDIGMWNLSCYSRGMMGYPTPNIDRIASEGMLFTDYYAEQSCTAGRATFIMGQSVFRSGFSKVGLPGATQGMGADDPTKRAQRPWWSLPMWPTSNPHTRYLIRFNSRSVASNYCSITPARMPAECQSKS